jgi:ABC-type glycerol-3-phosphate transport system substrate-binding protein
MAFFANEWGLHLDMRFQIAGAVDGNPFPTKDSARWSDETGVQAYQFVMDLYNVHRLDSIAEGLVCRDRFGAGNAVTMYQWSWFNGTMDNQFTDIDWGLRLQPSLNGGPIYGNRGPDVGFTLTTQNDAMLEPSITFYQYLLSPAYLAKYCKLRGIQPSLREMWEDPEFSAESGPHWAAVWAKNQPENSVDLGFWPLELVNITNRVTPAVRDEGEDVATVLQREDAASNEYLQGNAQWSILSAADFEANPQWLTVTG